MDTNKAFRQWQDRMCFTRRHASVSLGVAVSTVALYRAGERKEGEVEVPRHILLACAALEAQLQPICEKTDNPIKE